MSIRKSLLYLTLLGACQTLHAQTDTTIPLDPTRNLPASTPLPHPPLSEQYIWTAGDATVHRADRNKFPWTKQQLRIDPHFFRSTFSIDTVPRAATLYVAGPRNAKVYLNGKLAASFTSDIDAPIGFHVFHANVTALLHAGENILAIEAVRGRGIVAAAGSDATQQLTYGEVLAAKILPAPFGAEATPLTYSNATWKSATATTPNWFAPTFDEALWKSVDSLGPIDSNVDFLQWNADAGMYEWPGYTGISPWLRTYSLRPAAVTHIYPSSAQLAHIDTLPTSGSAPFTITNLGSPTDSEAPGLLLDFGREVAGRLLVESTSACESTLSVAYGESEIEAMSTGLSSGQQGGNYLGTNLLHVPPNGIARGPKSAFRYVRLRFLRGCPTLTFKSIRLEGIYDPVGYQGTFESSDPLLNRIWETGAYTAHLCMQDGIWDAPKRDRGRWVGDLDIEGPVIADVFGDSAMIEDTLRRLAPNDSSHVNGIPSYSALWITSLATSYNHTGDKAFLASQHDTLLRILATMDADLDPSGTFTNASHQWLFVDWAPNLYAFTPEARIGTQLQYLRAYKAAASLLTALGDSTNAAKYQARAAKVLTVTRATLRDPNHATYGSTWQLNALAQIAAEPGSQASATIWSNILSHVKQDTPTDQVISPYFNAYVLQAMSDTNHRSEALHWIRQYWGGMLAEGATSFWESYDLRWPKTNPHLSLQADGTSGYFVSMAHGWSSGPTSWLMENILGITPLDPGYNRVSIRPDLLGLDWARGQLPTPHGAIKISIDKLHGIELDLPSGIDAASVYIPTSDPSITVYLDGKIYPRSVPQTLLTVLQLTTPGHHTIIVGTRPQ